MHDEEIKAVAAELAVARAGKPSQPGSTRKRILYTPESIQRAIRLFRRSGERPSVFALRLGVSASALMRWSADIGDGAAFIPVRAAVERPASAATAAAIVTEAPGIPEITRPAAAPAPRGPTVVVRETVVSIPADLDFGRVREILEAVRGGAPC